VSPPRVSKETCVVSIHEYSEKAAWQDRGTEKESLLNSCGRDDSVRKVCSTQKRSISQRFLFILTLYAGVVFEDLL